MILFNLMPFYSLLKTNELQTVLIIVSIVSLIIIYLRRMNVLNDSSTVRLNREQMSAQSMVKLKNPIMFKICEESLNCDNYRQGVKVSTMCDNSFWIIAFWAVSIEELHYSLAIEWQSMRQSLLDQKFIEDHCLFKSDPELYYESNENVIHWIKPPNEFFTGETLGYNPRTRYPLVVIIVRNDDDDGIEFNDNDVVSLISIIHLKDSFCKMNSGLITQYLKQRGGKVFNLHQLFTPKAECEPQSDQLCVICLTSPITHATLPCRHTCLCSQCFQKVDICPLCRSSITSFFRIGGEESNADNESDSQTIPQTSAQSSGWFTYINTKFNQWFHIN